MSCLFCRVVAGEIPATVVHRDDQVVAFQDIDPKAPTHVLVIPVEHIASAKDVRVEHGVVLARMVAVAVEVARQNGIADSGYRLVYNVGPDAGQSVDHLHMHVIGGRKLAWPPG